MPTYAYRCENCGVQFDRFQTFSESPLVRCPECGEDTLRKLYGPVGIVFKGSGFYSTDHRSASGQAPSKKTEGSTSGEKTPAGDKNSTGDKTSASDKASTGDTSATEKRAPTSEKTPTSRSQSE
jgi:putative FmdB family regulatory protein